MRRGDSQTVSGSTEGSDENFRFRDCSLSPETPSAAELLDRFHALAAASRIVVWLPKSYSENPWYSDLPPTASGGGRSGSSTDPPLTLTPAPGWRTRPIAIDVPSAKAEPQPELKPEPKPEAEPTGETTAKKAVRQVVCRWRIQRQLDGGARIVRTRSRSPYFECQALTVG